MIDNENNKIFELKEGKGFIEEYDEFNLTKFEGEYLYGQNNGKGKEYNISDNRLIYEGEYLNGKRNGIGKLYNKLNDLIFEGEFYYGYKKRGKNYVKGIL